MLIRKLAVFAFSSSLIIAINTMEKETANWISKNRHRKCMQTPAYS